MKDSVGRITTLVGLIIAFSPIPASLIWVDPITPFLLFVTIPIGLTVYLVGRAIGSSGKNSEVVNAPKSPLDVSGRGWAFWMVVILGTILFIAILTNLFEKPPVQY